MSSPIVIDVCGGKTEERHYISSVIENSLTKAGFVGVENNAVAGEVNDTELVTLLDYARNANPDLFDSRIQINSVEVLPDDPEEEVEVSDIDEEAEVD